METAKDAHRRAARLHVQLRAHRAAMQQHKRCARQPVTRVLLPRLKVVAVVAAVVAAAAAAAAAVVAAVAADGGAFYPRHRTAIITSCCWNSSRLRSGKGSSRCGRTPRSRRPRSGDTFQHPRGDVATNGQGKAAAVTTVPVLAAVKTEKKPKSKGQDKAAAVTTAPALPAIKTEKKPNSTEQGKAAAANTGPANLHRDTPFCTCSTKSGRAAP